MAKIHRTQQLKEQDRWATVMLLRDQIPQELETFKTTANVYDHDSTFLPRWDLWPSIYLEQKRSREYPDISKTV